ncbi:MBL fold metallo-hydrolase [Paenibacillus harenae]|uniref:Glyoxylase-like metal-dependent hydrolase (Beta-lactamase superfamily II) n=1 Tax=Paenibacillus harenae TaxID=306543 RepID=A0ABT9UBZ4_PAEHA|nr:MBL fold metallo-hydrolase [Paenibacillus harenae]MDQ0116230.1 glyoxylase-like metal-dependent hydrolase (beta-lactamase superfamily II) [Paenibacillus harenae]
MRLFNEGSVHQLMIGKFESFSVNVYFVEEENELTLIDTALQAFTDDILQAAQQLNKPITKILITFYVSRREAKLLNNDMILEPGEPNTPIMGKFTTNLMAKPDFLVQNGDRIGSLKVIADPGHTPGSTAFLDERYNVLIAGDAGGLAVAGVVRSSFSMPAKRTWNKELAVASVRKLLSVNPSLLAVGHGMMLSDPFEAMEMAIDEATRLL